VVGAGGHDGLGLGGGVAFQVGATFNADLSTVLEHNHASTSDDDVAPNLVL
jgi:hypothetical protein